MLRYFLTTTLPFTHILIYRYQVSDPDAIINILKSSLRTSNVHLTNATLSALPTILSLLISHSTNHAQLSAPSLSSSVSTASVGFSGVLDVVTLRQALTSFLPAGGVIDRLGDKERAQLKARDTLVILGGFAFRSGSGSAISKASKGVETPIAIFERLLKEVGLASKVWKVREQVHVFSCPYKFNCGTHFAWFFF
jgi:CLIP-associating protein 1/2